MAWTAPITWVFNQFVDEDDLNAQIRDNMLILHPGYATTLPGSPSDSQMAILVDSTSAPSYWWMFRYNAGSASSFKWEFFGGRAYKSALANINWNNQTSYTMTNSPTEILVPRAGEYDVIVGGSAQRVIAGGGTTGYISYNINGAGAADSKASIDGPDPAGAGAIYMVIRETLVASDAVRIAYRASNTGVNHYLDNASLSLLPVRVS